MRSRLNGRSPWRSWIATPQLPLRGVLLSEPTLKQITLYTSNAADIRRCENRGFVELSGRVNLPAQPAQSCCVRMVKDRISWSSLDSLS